MRINIAFEDMLQEAALEKIFSALNCSFTIVNRLSHNGKGYLKKNIQAFNKSSTDIPLVLITDLDTSPCPPALIASWLPGMLNENFLFRVAVTEVESWLIAHKDAFSSYIGIPKNKINFDPETIKDPKEFVVNLAKKSKSRDIRYDLLPGPKSGAHVGPNYNGCLAEFIIQHWDPLIAREYSASLSKAMRAVTNLHARISKQ